MHPESVHQAPALRTEAEPACNDRAQAPKERPILFSGAMVRALLAGTKTQTRRVVKGAPEDWAPVGPEVFSPTVIDRHGDEQPGPDSYGAGNEDGDCWIRCPYGAPGDRLWVRETFSGPYCMEAQEGIAAAPPSKWGLGSRIWYWADGDPTEGDWTRPRPSIHMPRWASRITLEVTGVRVERLHDISEEDARAEGIVPFGDGNGWHTEDGRHYAGTAADAYLNLWADINGTASAEASPWVWVLSFRQAASVN